MLDKLYKLAVIVLAVSVSSVLALWFMKPTEAISQQSKPTPATPASPTSATPMYAIPESHEWEAVANYPTNYNGNSSSGLLLYNKRTGEAYWCFATGMNKLK